MTFRLRIMLAVLIAVVGFSAALAQGDHGHHGGNDDSGFTLPRIAGALFEDTAAAARGFWRSLGIISVADDIDSPYTSLPHSRTEDGAFVLGDPAAPVTIIEFADFGCPHCQTYKSTIDQLVDQYVATGMARLEYRSFPTAGGAITEFASKVQECAEQQRPGAYWDAYVLYYDLALMGRFNDDAHRTVARELGLSYSDILQCTETASQVRNDVNFGVANGVAGTPAVMIRIGDGDAQWIVYGGVTYNRGGVPFEVLAAVIESFQGEGA